MSQVTDSVKDPYTEVLKQFREWNRTWDEFDKNHSGERPIDSDGFIESLKERFSIDFILEQ